MTVLRTNTRKIDNTTSPCKRFQGKLTVKFLWQIDLNEWIKSHYKKQIFTVINRIIEQII